MKQQLISIHGRLFKDPMVLVLLVNGWFILGIAFFEEWQRSVADLHVFQRERTGSSKR